MHSIGEVQETEVRLGDRTGGSGQCPLVQLGGLPKLPVGFAVGRHADPFHRIAPGPGPVRPKLDPTAMQKVGVGQERAPSWPSTPEERIACHDVPFHAAAANRPPPSRPTPTQDMVLRQSIAEKAPNCTVRCGSRRLPEMIAKNAPLPPPFVEPVAMHHPSRGHESCSSCATLEFVASLPVSRTWRHETPSKCMRSVPFMGSNWPDGTVSSPI